jgi:hypothetical protein
LTESLKNAKSFHLKFLIQESNLIKLILLHLKKEETALEYKSEEYFR